MESLSLLRLRLAKVIFLGKFSGAGAGINGLRTQLSEQNFGPKVAFCKLRHQWNLFGGMVVRFAVQSMCMCGGGFYLLNKGPLRINGLIMSPKATKDIIEALGAELNE